MPVVATEPDEPSTVMPSTRPPSSPSPVLEVIRRASSRPMLGYAFSMVEMATVFCQVLLGLLATASHGSGTALR